MSTFVQGIIEEMQGEAGIYYELMLRLPDGQILPIFYSYPREERKANREDPISPLLKLGQAYELLIIIRTGHNPVRYLSREPAGTTFKLVAKEFIGRGYTVRRNDVLQGKVLDSYWDPATEQYQAIYTPEMYERRYILLETAIGKALLSREYLKEDLGEQDIEQITVGGYLEWDSSRQDILAIL